MIFHTKYPKNFHAPLGAIFLSVPPPLTWNAGSTPATAHKGRIFRSSSVSFIDRFNCIANDFFKSTQMKSTIYRMCGIFHWIFHPLVIFTFQSTIVINKIVHIFLCTYIYKYGWSICWHTLLYKLFFYHLIYRYMYVIYHEL